MCRYGTVVFVGWCSRMYPGGSVLKISRGLKLTVSAVALTQACLMSGAAWAQRGDEDVLSVAEDAFGTKVGNDNVGLYGPNSARGFNPMQAGNVRIEGLYFDQQAFLGRAAARSTTMRVGLSAQSYPFAAPTGIADTSLVMPDDTKTVFSLSNDTSRPTGLNSILVGVSTPITDELGIAVASLPYSAPHSQGGAHGARWNFGTIVRWRPSSNLDVVPFIFYQRSKDEEVAPSVYTSGAFLPPEIDRDVFFGQNWADRATDELNYGLIMRGRPFANWRLQGAIFGSEVDRSTNYVISYRNTDASGVGSLDILKYPSHRQYSVSGEVRATGVFTQGKFRHTVHLATRARDTRRVFGGGRTVNFGPAMIGVYQEKAEPAYTLGIRDKDVVKQITPGVSYAGQLANIGEFSVGLQKSFYDRTFGKIGSPTASTRSEPWLYNATLAYYVSSKLVVYGSYSRGLEEFGTAPDNTANAGEPLQAQMSKQIDAGLRYTIIPGLNMMVGIFDISKPYYDRDSANLYTVVGNLKHQGVEFSLTGRPFTGVTVVAGAVYIKARVSGLPVDNGTIGKIAPGVPPFVASTSVQYSHPSWNGFTLEVQGNLDSSQTANRTNTFEVPSLMTFGVVARYPFTIGETKAAVRVAVNNITNENGWTVDGNSGRFSPVGVRTYAVRLSADF
jgi:iron complex outermembrane receptor protein